MSKQKPRNKSLSPLSLEFPLYLSSSKYDNIVGIDEVGRGCWAGPLVMCAYSISRTAVSSYTPIQDVYDSKQVNPHKRQEVAKAISLQEEQGVSRVFVVEKSAHEISQYGLASCIHSALEELIAKFSGHSLFLLDAGLKPNSEVDYRSYIKGDSKVYSIAAASIYAKVYRDDLLQSLHNQYPQYGWNSNVGYGTKEHIEALNQYGVTPYHRLSFKPIKDLYKHKVSGIIADSGF